jgi:hypothetical protein
MTHDADMTEISPAVGPVAAPSAAAERIRLHRERRRKGLRCLIVDLRETEIDALIQRGLLKPDTRNNRRAVSQALYAFLDRTLGATA